MPIITVSITMIAPEIPSRVPEWTMFSIMESNEAPNPFFRQSPNISFILDVRIYGRADSPWPFHRVSFRISLLFVRPGSTSSFRLSRERRGPSS